MNDTHVFGINNEHGVRLVTVLGSMGEVFGLASYRGSAGTNFLLRLRNGEFAPEIPDARFYQDALLVDFVPRKEPYGRRIAPSSSRSISNRRSANPSSFPSSKATNPGTCRGLLMKPKPASCWMICERAFPFAELLRTNLALYDSRQENEFPFFPASVSEPLTLDQFEWHTISPAPPPADPPVDTHAFDLPPLLALPQPPAVCLGTHGLLFANAHRRAAAPLLSQMALGVDAATGMILAFQLAARDRTMAQAAARGLIQSIKASGSPARRHQAGLHQSHSRLAATG